MLSNTGWPNPRDHPDNANLPNVNHPETILGTTISFLVIALVALSLRLWVRFRDHLWGWDDGFVLAAGIASVAGDIIVCQMPADGLGLHLWTLDEPHLTKYFQHIYSSNVSYCASATLIKLAILFQYLRLFAESSASTTNAQYRLARRTTFALIALSSAWGIAFFLLGIFPCHPITKYWNTTLPGSCIGWGTKIPDTFFAMFLGHSASNMLLDLLVLLLPLPFLRMLRLGGKSKAGLISLFAMGCIVGAVALGRMIALSVNRAGTIPVIDMTYHTPVIYIFAVLEVNVAIIAASIPVFWPVIATLATNKIWVVNEIEIHVEGNRRDSFRSLSPGGGIDLAEQGEWKDGKDDFGERTSKLGVVAKVYDRANSRQNRQHHHKISNASSTIGRSLGIDFGTRSSQDSQRYLYRPPSHEVGSTNCSLTQGDRDDWQADVDKQNMGGTMTTRVQKTEIPFAQINAPKK